MRKIALIADGWKQYVVYAWAEGMLRKIRASNDDIGIFMYNCFGNWNRDADHQKGEYNIFNLPDLKSFDGIVIDITNIAEASVRKNLINKVLESKVPAISIGVEIPGMYYVGIDNRQPILTIIDHLHNVHNCSKFVFAAGPKENYENFKRVEAYKEGIAKYGLNIDENPIFYGNFEYASGIELMHNYLKKKLEFPDAFICANDNIAVGLCREAEKNGYKVPRDFIITGFDNLEKARFYAPQITTANLDRENIAEKALELLKEIWNDNYPQIFNYVSADILYGESCGCPNNGLVEYREYIKESIDVAAEKEIMSNRLLLMEGKVARQDTFAGKFDIIRDYMKKNNLEGYYVCVDKKLFSPDLDTKFPKFGYDLDNFVIPVAMERKESLEFVSVNEFYSYIYERCAGNLYLFTPIHFSDEAVGFTVIKNPSFLYWNPNWYEMEIGVVHAFQNQFRKDQLRTAVTRLKDIYNRDQLTGIYNRLAFSEYFEKDFEDYNKKGVVNAVFFVDADSFKIMNDTYGHEFGDKVLKKIAQTMSDFIPEHGNVCRYGGDEFVAVYPNATPQNARNYIDQVRGTLQRENISVSIGMTLTTGFSDISLSEYVSIADQNMYKAKRKQKN